jgi:predicted nucleic acid-binding protein
VSAVVSDTGPLRYLAECGQTELLSGLFGQVFAPPAVLAELSQPGTPLSVRQWIARPPTWLQVRAAVRRQTWPRLGPGETEALNLAAELTAEAVLMDDLEARHMARDLGFRVIGTLGIVELAALLGIVDFDSITARLLETNIRLDPRLVQEARRRVSAGPPPPATP